MKFSRLNDSWLKMKRLGASSVVLVCMCIESGNVQKMRAKIVTRTLEMKNCAWDSEWLFILIFLNLS